MEKNNDLRERILNSTSYWIEGINGLLYDSILEFKEKNNMRNSDLAKHLGVSRGRVSQILNDGDINFSLETIIQIALKIDFFPKFELTRKQDFYAQEKLQKERNQFYNKIYLNDLTSNQFCSPTTGEKTVSISSKNENRYSLAL